MGIAAAGVEIAADNHRADAIEAMRKLVEQGTLDFEPGRDLLNDPKVIEAYLGSPT